MRAETGTAAALAADNRFIRFFIKEDSLHNAGVFAFPAANAFILFKNNAAARPVLKRRARTHFKTGRIFTGNADDGNKFPGHTTACLNLYRTF